ncbi:transposase [Lysobacter capsici]|uniref:transposase n=1 Tax=Lysobacter capsici TaxID=435897 RepID=UPI0009EAD5DC|nr:transposase [Lysobacter capsici]
MPRQPRIDLPHIAQHVVQRGNDRRPCFFQDVDYLRYLSELHKLAERAGCAIHAYVLMTNHVHLLLTPSRAGQVSAVMQAMGRRYVRYVNDRYHRTGTLWEGRYKACPVDTDSYLLHCYRYIELNPVRAGMVSAPGDYRWSSYHANASGQSNALLTPHPTYLALGTDRAYRQHAYARLVAEILNPDDVALIRLRLQRQHALGTDRFRAMIEAQLLRRAGPAKIGRPSKARSVSTSGLKSPL